MIGLASGPGVKDAFFFFFLRDLFVFDAIFALNGRVFALFS